MQPKKYVFNFMSLSQKPFTFYQDLWLFFRGEPDLRNMKFVLNAIISVKTWISRNLRNYGRLDRVIFWKKMMVHYIGDGEFNNFKRFLEIDIDESLGWKYNLGVVHKWCHKLSGVSYPQLFWGLNSRSTRN